LDHAAKAIELEDIEARVSELERAAEAVEAVATRLQVGCMSNLLSESETGIAIDGSWQCTLDSKVGWTGSKRRCRNHAGLADVIPRSRAGSRVSGSSGAANESLAETTMRAWISAQELQSQLRLRAGYGA